MRLGVLATHPIQYHAPLYRALAAELDLTVYFAHRQSAAEQAAAGFGVAFEWDVDLLGGYRPGFLENRAARPSTQTFGGCSTPEIADHVRDERFNAFLVNGWYNRSFWQAMAACWRTGTPLMVRGDSHLGTPRRALVRLAKEAFYRAFIPRFDAYLAVGERSREYYRYYGAREERIHFVPHFVDNAYFAERAAAAGQRALRDELGVGPDVKLALFVGKFIPEKRPADVVAAAGVLRGRGEAVEVVFVGAGGLETELRAAADAAGVPAHFVGFKNQSELPRYYAGADALVLPSVSETWGLVVNEAMACGLPAAVSDAVGCAPDLVGSGTTGRTFPVADVPAFADALGATFELKRRPETARALDALMQTYSLQTAVRGVIGAVEAVR